jgi:phosphatidylserine/phosphatidylglycerophosphate/cardiolipin synthase-like enzyme
MRYTVGHLYILLIIVLVAFFSDIFLLHSNKDSNIQPDIKVFFTPGKDCERNIIKEIDKAKTIDIAVYSISNQNIVDSIIAAKKNGAKIRVITDRTQAKVKGSLIDSIRSAGIPVLTNKKHKIEHNKFAVFDDEYIVSGSYNWTTNASMYNSENCNFFKQPNKEYSQRFEYLWNLYNN